MDRPHLDSAIVSELHLAVPRRNWSRLIEFILIYAISACALYQIIIRSTGGVWIYLACIPLYLLAAASLHGISLFTHEAVHGTLSQNRALNRALGIACAIPVLQNFAAYKVLHLRHHHLLGLPGDPDDYDNYTNWTWLVLAMHWGRLIAGYPAYITAIPILGWRHGKAAERFWIAFEVLLIAIAIIAILISPAPRLFLLHAWLIPMLFINTLVNIRGMSQHTLLENQSDTIQGTRSILTNRVTAYFMCNENYHLEHHLYPGVPWYNLPRLHQALRTQLIDRGAPFINSYFAFVWQFITLPFSRPARGPSPTPQNPRPQ